MAAADELGYTKLALAGGVAANSMLRDKLSEMSIWQEIRLICR